MYLLCSTVADRTTGGWEGRVLILSTIAALRKSWRRIVIKESLSYSIYHLITLRSTSTLYSDSWEVSVFTAVSYMGPPDFSNRSPMPCREDQGSLLHRAPEMDQARSRKLLMLLCKRGFQRSWHGPKLFFLPQALNR